MRIAVLSDIHGNLPALEAVLADVERQSPDQIWCAGDIAFFGPWAAECIALVREAGWTTVRGNTDVWITGDPQTVDDPEKRRRFHAVAEAHAIGGDDAAWLLQLPLGHSGPGSTLMVHGTPVSPFEAPLPDAPAAEFAPYAGRAAIVIYGHVHRAFSRRISDGTIVCNPGSVGLPFDGETASYLLLHREGPEVAWKHLRVPFDREHTLKEARRAGGAIEREFVQATAQASG